MAACLNAANEEMVAGFSAGDALRRHSAAYRNRHVAASQSPARTLEDLIETDGWARAQARELIGRGKRDGARIKDAARRNHQGDGERSRRITCVAGEAQHAESYAWCGRLAESHYENFTIASWLMPRAMRPHMHAIYAYARIADDFADEEQDLGKLDEWERELDPLTPARRAIRCSSRWRTPPRYDIPREPFADLLWRFAPT